MSEENEFETALDPEQALALQQAFETHGEPEEHPASDPVSALQVQIDNLTDALGEAFDKIETLQEEVDQATNRANDAHVRLDKAREVIKRLRGAQTTQAPKPSTPAPTQNTSRPKACTVPGCEQTHTDNTELNACWQRYYASQPAK